MDAEDEDYRPSSDHDLTPARDRRERLVNSLITRVGYGSGVDQPDLDQVNIQNKIKL